MLIDDAGGGRAGEMAPGLVRHGGLRLHVAAVALVLTIASMGLAYPN